MKHYEVYIKLIDKKKVVRNNTLRIVDIDNENDSKFSYLADEQYPYRSEKANNINKITEYLLMKSNKDRAMIPVDMTKNYIKFIARVKDEYKKNIEYLIKLAVDYINSNIVFGDEEESFLIDEETYYTEISAKEFLIDNLSKLENDMFESSDKNIKSFMQVLDEPNYKVRDLCQRGDTLNFDFISSFDVSKKLSHDKIIEKYDDILFNEELKDEIDRIYNSNNENNIKISPVHYEVFSCDEKLRDEMYTCIGEALYNNNRIKKRKAIKFKMDMTNNYVSNDSIDVILRKH